MAKLVTAPSTEADVRLLLQRFDSAAPDGRVLRHDEIEHTISESRASSRYKLIVRRWRRVLFEEKNIWLDGRAARGVGFACLTASDRLRWSRRRLRDIGRGLRKAITVAATTPDQDLTSSAERIWKARLVTTAEMIYTQHGRALRELTERVRLPSRVLPR